MANAPTTTTRRLFLTSGSAGAVFAALGAVASAKAGSASIDTLAELRAALLDAYDEWLLYERRMLHVERFGLEAAKETEGMVPVSAAHNYHFPAFGDPARLPPSSRAAAGCGSN
jgi:hypothetical protein